MSEQMEYNITAKGFKFREEIDEFLELCSEWESQDGMEINADSLRIVDVWWSEGWRGGGHSAKELIKDQFESWLDDHPHIKFTATATYKDQAPMEIEYER